MWDPFRNIHEEWHERIEDLQRFRGLRLWILHILDEHGPANGVEIMDAVQEHQMELNLRRSGRSKECRPHRPSPGSVYPMLKKMVDEGLINKTEDGKYELTERGKKIISKMAGRLRHFKERELGIISIDRALNEIEIYLSYFEDIKDSKLDSHKEKIEELSERFKRIEESLQ